MNRVSIKAFTVYVNMKSLMLSLFFIAISEMCFSQDNNDGHQKLTIVDVENSKAIPGATVLFKNGKYFKSDNNGNVFIKKADINPLDSLAVSCIGYNPQKIVVINYVLPDSIKLLRSTTLLNEVKVSGLGIKEIPFGDFKEKYNRHWAPLINEEFVKYIPNPQKVKGKIIALEYKVNDRLGGIDMPFRASLYSKNDSSLFPDKELLKDSIIIYNKDKKKDISIDISKYDIELPENGFFILFETLDSTRYSNRLVKANNLTIQKVPGLDFDHFDNSEPMLNYQQKLKTDLKYSIFRIKKGDWTVLTVDDHAMGAKILPY